MIKRSGARFVALGVVLLGAVWCHRGNAQATGDLLCNGGGKDLTACESDDDCFSSCTAFGPCVVAYGVCDGGDFDGFPCDCPGGTCTGGTCQGGPFAGDSCTAEVGNGNCPSGTACIGTSHICGAGDFKAYPCLRNAHCTNDNGTPQTCVATGKFCNGGDFDSTSCVDSTDCTGGGTCIAPDFSDVCAGTATPTRTPRPGSPTPTITVGGPTPTRTPTRTGPILTPTRTPTGPITVLPSRTPTESPTGPRPTNTPTTTLPRPTNTRTVTASVTRTVPNSTTAAEDTPPNTSRVVVTDGNRLPQTGTIVRIGDETVNIAYIRSPGGNVLSINPPYSKAIAAGTAIVVGQTGSTHVYVSEGGGCNVSGGEASGLSGLIAGLLIGLAARRRG